MSRTRLYQARLKAFIFLSGLASLAVGTYFQIAMLTGQVEMANISNVVEVCRYKWGKKYRETQCSDVAMAQKLVTDGYHFDNRYHRVSIHYQTPTGPKVAPNIFVREQDWPGAETQLKTLVSPMISNGVMPYAEELFFANFFWFGLIFVWPAVILARRSPFWGRFLPKRWRRPET